MAVVSLTNLFIAFVSLVITVQTVRSELICIYQGSQISTLDCRPLGNNFNVLYDDSMSSAGYDSAMNKDDVLKAIDLRDCNIVLVNNNSFVDFPDLNSLDLSRNLINLLDSGMFSAMKKLTFLNLSHNALTEFGSNFFDGMDELRVLDISDNIMTLSSYTGFQSVPKLQIFDYSRNIAIDLAGTKFGKELLTLNLATTRVFLDLDAFSNLASLQRLDLSFTQLINLPNSLMKSCPSLLSVILSTNFLITDGGDDSLNEDSFGFNEKLVEIDLSSNSLTNINGLFTKNVRLRKLDLSKNKIVSLDAAALSANRDIVYLNLSANKMRRLPANVFSNFKNLQQLDLSSNNIGYIDEHMFSGNPKLELLHLNGNGLKSLSGSQFVNNKRLQRLHLAENLLETMIHETIAGLDFLMAVDLTGNRLSSIPAKFFKLLRLEVLILNCNNLTQVPDDFFESDVYFGKRIVYFDGNPWKCPCIRNAMDSAEISSIDYGYDMFNDGAAAFCVFQEDRNRCDNTPLSVSELAQFKARPELNGKLC